MIMTKAADDEKAFHENMSWESGSSLYRRTSLAEDLLTWAVHCGAADLHLTVGKVPVLRVNGNLCELPELLSSECEPVSRVTRDLVGIWPSLNGPITPSQAEEIARSLLRDKRHSEVFAAKGNVDLAYAIPGLSRFRVNVYRQRGSYAVACRVLADRVPDLQELFPYSPGWVAVMRRLAGLTRGLVLVTGPTGSGKSTTLAAMVDYINSSFKKHIITLEDPVEYLHRHKLGIVNQREVGEDVESFAEGLRAALREDPDVIMVGEMRDMETIATAITAAETGHLVFSTLHTNTASETVDRIIDVFPPHQQQQIRVQLASVLRGVISQQLLPRKNGQGLVCAVEMLVGTHAVKALIRENKTHQLSSVLQTGLQDGMVPLERSLADMVAGGLVAREVAMDRAYDPRLLVRYLDRK